MIAVFSFIFLSIIPITFSVKIQCLKEIDKNPLRNGFPDVDKVLLKNDYEITVRYTNWLNKHTGKFVEKNSNSTFLATKTVRDAVYNLYEYPSNITVFLKSNVTNGFEIEHECHKIEEDAAEKNIYEISPDLADFLDIKGDKFSVILASVIENNRYNTSKLDETGTNITAGVETIGWLGCAHNITPSNLTIQANVYFSGTFSQPPYSSAFKNPFVYSIHLQAYHIINSKNSTTFNITDHVSFDVVTVDKIDLTETTFSLPRGKYCNNMPAADFPDALPSSFKARLQYFDVNDKWVDDVELLFDSSELIFSFGSNFKSDRDIPFIGYTDFDKNVRVVHDFKYGFQYVLSRNGTYCYGVEPIDAKMGDVREDKNGFLYIRSPADVLFNMTGENVTHFYYAGKVLTEGGLVLSSYVSKKLIDEKLNEDRKNYIIVEILFTTAGWEIGGKKLPQLHSIVQYHTNKLGIVNRRTTIRMNSLLNNSLEGRTPWIYNNVLSCLPTFNEEELFFISLQNATLSDLRLVGFERVENALIEAIAHVGNLSVLRITNVMFMEMHNKLLACFIVSERTNVKPAKTAYLMPELSVSEIRDALNKSINGTNTFNVTISNGDDHKHKLIITSNEFGRLPIHSFPPPQPLPPLGYSVSSMFVLGLFMFIFGAFSVIGGYVFYNSRKRIREMAYQVFE